VGGTPTDRQLLFALPPAGSERVELWREAYDLPDGVTELGWRLTVVRDGAERTLRLPRDFEALWRALGDG
jgi:hypothetical protein